jgi:hypothetical protein
MFNEQWSYDRVSKTAQRGTMGTNRGADSGKASQNSAGTPGKNDHLAKYDHWCKRPPRDLQLFAVATALRNCVLKVKMSICVKGHLPARQLGAAASTINIQLVA